MKTKRRKPRGSSNAGRKRADGERFDCGKLKPPEPNAKVLEIRRALAGPHGDIAKAENPLDLMLARRWITEDQHKAGRDYAHHYRKAGMDMPSIRTADYGEAWPERGLTVPPAWAEGGDPQAMIELHQMWTLMGEGVKREMTHVCVMDSWPQWVVYRAAGKLLPPTIEQRRAYLMEGLDIVRLSLDGPKGRCTFRNSKIAV